MASCGSERAGGGGARAVYDRLTGIKRKWGCGGSGGGEGAGVVDGERGRWSWREETWRLFF